jgi:N-acetylglutamate synthase-like GNAT family acetyltransferase
MNKQIIRTYHLSDKVGLFDIFKHYIPSDFAPSEIHDFDSYLKEYWSTYFTIEIDGQIVGSIGYQLIDAETTGQIKWILIHPEYAGKGLGKMAIEHCLTIFKTKPKVKKVIVTTSQLAYQFFEKFGFILKKSEKDFWGKGFDFYLLEKNL